MVNAQLKRLLKATIKLEEDEWIGLHIWLPNEENTYRDEEGNPFDPNADYIEEEEYQPYCAVVDDTCKQKYI